MHLGYIGFLLPLFFGWQLQGRMEKALDAKRSMSGDALLMIPIALAVVIVTPAWWLWFHPPETTETRMPMAFMIGAVSGVVIMLSAMAHAVFHKLRS